MAKPARKSSTAKAKPPEQPPLLEWIAAGLGLVLTVAVIGFLAWEATQADDAPPSFATTAAAPITTGSGHYIAISVRNQGRVTASSVEVEAQLKRGDAVAESASIVFDFLPEGSERSGGVYFRLDPADYQLTLQAKGQVDP